MAFHQYGQTVKFPRNEYVDIHVREVTLNASAPSSEHVHYIEVREFLKEGEVYGHGLLLPRTGAVDLCRAFQQLNLFEKRSTGAAK